jgi:hypothetical protein
MARPLYLYGISDCVVKPELLQGWEDPNEIVGWYMGGTYAIQNQPITYTVDLCINDPNMPWRLESNVEIVGQTVTWSGRKGIHYHYHQLIAADTNEVLDQGTYAVYCVPRGQLKGITKQ